MTQLVFITSIWLFSSCLDVLLYFVFFTYKKKQICSLFGIVLRYQLHLHLITSTLESTVIHDNVCSFRYPTLTLVLSGLTERVKGIFFKDARSCFQREYLGYF